MENKKSLFKLKIALDIIMLAILLLLFKKNNLGMEFHEEAGLFIFGLFIIHNLLNYKWITAVTPKIFKKGFSKRLKISWHINFLLFVSMTAIIVTGLMINKTLPFSIPSLQGAKQWHYFFAALSIVLMGIHLGLHWPLLKNMFKNLQGFGKTLVKMIGIAALIISVSWGGYNLVTGNFITWVKGPFITATMEKENFKAPSEASHEEGQNIKHGNENGMGKDTMPSTSAGTIIINVANTCSMMMVFAAATALITNRKKQKVLNYK